MVQATAGTRRLVAGEADDHRDDVGRGLANFESRAGSDPGESAVDVAPHGALGFEGTDDPGARLAAERERGAAESPSPPGGCRQTGTRRGVGRGA